MAGIGSSRKIVLVPKILCVVILCVQAAACQELLVGKAAPGMTKIQVLQKLGKPASVRRYSPHAYLVDSRPPLFPYEESWFYQEPEGGVYLLFQGNLLRQAHAQSLQWRGRTYSGETWPSIERQVLPRYPGKTIGFSRIPVIRGFYYSNLDARERQKRSAEFERVGGKHHFDARGDIYRGAPGQICQTCRELRSSGLK